MRFSTTVALAVAAIAASIAAPAAAQNAWLADWASQKSYAAVDAAVAPAAGAPALLLEFRPRAVRAASPGEKAMQDATIELYGSLIGANTPASFLWTGIESGNPLTRDEAYRWDSLRDQGLFDAGARAKIVAELQSLGIFNVRIGLSNHLIDLDREQSWAAHDAFVEDLARGGLNLSLDLHHFGIEDRFRVVGPDGATDHAASYYLHPDWPDYFARFAAAAFARYGDKIKAVTIVNEPETTVGFNSEMWHGAHPGWGDPRHDEVYVERALQIAAAAVKARLAIEAQAKASGRRVLFMHTEAAVVKPGRPDFNRHLRFFPSDLILGQDWLLDADVARLAAEPPAQLARAWGAAPTRTRSSFDWVVDRYVGRAPLAEREARRDGLATRLAALQALHQRLRDEFGKTMKSDTVFAVDYYAHNEVKGRSGVPLSPEPQFYADQLRAGERAGLYAMIVDYYNRYGMAMMIGETGTPYHHFGAFWHEQLLLESARAMQDGTPLLGQTIYPLVDTWGWETALSRPRDETMLNPGGVLDADYEPRPFIDALLRSLDSQTAATEAAVAPEAAEAAVAVQ